MAIYYGYYIGHNTKSKGDELLDHYWIRPIMDHYGSAAGNNLYSPGQAWDEPRYSTTVTKELACIYPHA